METESFGDDGVGFENRLHEVLHGGACPDHRQVRAKALAVAVEPVALEAPGTLRVVEEPCPAARIALAFRTCRGGENLLALGMEADLAAAAAIDSLAVVPRLDRRGEVLVACG